MKQKKRKKAAIFVKSVFFFVNETKPHELINVCEITSTDTYTHARSHAHKKTHAYARICMNVYTHAF